MSQKVITKLLTISEASQILHVHANTLRNWEKEGVIEVVRIGPRRDRRYRKDTIEKMMEGVV